MKHFLRMAAVSLACLGTAGSALALSEADFGKVYDGPGLAIDLNDSNVVLLNGDGTNFVLFDLASKTGRTVGVDATLMAQGYKYLAPSDLNNQGQVSGWVRGVDASGTVLHSGFVWSPGAGFQLCPLTHCGAVLTDAGVAVTQQGVWSAQTGATDVALPGAFRASNNLAQRGYILRPTGVQSNGYYNDTARVGVVSSDGKELWNVIYPVQVSTGSVGNYEELIPQAMLMNDQGVSLVVFRGFAVMSTSTQLLVNGTHQSTISGEVVSLNNRGQMMTMFDASPSGRANFPSYVTQSERVSLQNLLGTWSDSRTLINDSGVILRPQASTFMVFQGPNLSDRASLPVVTAPPGPPVGTGQGLQGDYFNVGLFGNKLVTTRIENPDFDWGLGRPAPGVYANAFVVRWSGFIEAEEAGDYVLSTESDEGVRVTLDGQVVINNWRAHRLATDTSSTINLKAGQRLPIVIDYYDILGNATMRLKWRKPGASAATAVPTVRLYQP